MTCLNCGASADEMYCGYCAAYASENGILPAPGDARGPEEQELHWPWAR
jgi:hypothetical protein